MDTERGCLEVLFRKVPYQTISLTEFGGTDNSYESISSELFISYAGTVFPQCSFDELQQLHNFLQEHFDKKETVFTLLSETAEKMLQYDGKEPICCYEQVLRWRDISFQLGQDILTTAFMANMDIRYGQKTDFFAWRPIIRTNNSTLQQILSEGMAENHFHLNGSTQIFQLNWVCLMNHIQGRQKDFKAIDTLLDEKLQYSFQDSRRYNVELHDTLHQSVIKAAVYRLYLFLLQKEGIEEKENIQRFICGCQEKKTAKKEFIEFLIKVDESDVSRIQNMIQLTRYEYGFREEGITLDYAMDKELMVNNNNTHRILAGERKFLYECFRFSLQGQFDTLDQNIFYRYLNIYILFRSEVIQVNRMVGFANFSKYQDRKEFFIENYPPYKRELNLLAIKATLENQPKLTLEARFAPKISANELSKKIRKIDSDVGHESKTGFELLNTKHEQDKHFREQYFYVMHFIKDGDRQNEHPRDFVQRHDSLRRRVYLETKATIEFMEQDIEQRDRLVGIDAANSEIGCRPEVFASCYRYLRGWLPKRRTAVNQERIKKVRICGTFHAGEDFLDIADGLRTIDEAILFLNLDRGTRIGHALALGINPKEYYQYKKNVVRMPAQDLLDNTVWLLEKSREYGIKLDGKLASDLQRQFENLFAQIYGSSLLQNMNAYQYYCSWMLRGDDPELYLLKDEKFDEFVKERNPILLYNYYRVNRWISDEQRYNEKYRRLYFGYHFDRIVKENGKKTEKFIVTDSYVKMIFEIQEKMREDISKRGIAIECNPSSNYLIGTIERYDHHPIFRFNSMGLKEGWNNPLSVSINTDDQGVFDTYLENEYALLALALEKKKNEDGTSRYNSQEIYQWIDYVRKMGLQQSFWNEKR